MQMLAIALALECLSGDNDSNNESNDDIWHEIYAKTTKKRTIAYAINWKRRFVAINNYEMITDKDNYKKCQ